MQTNQPDFMPNESCICCGVIPFREYSIVKLRASTYIYKKNEESKQAAVNS